MKKEKQWAWPDVIFYELYGEQFEKRGFDIPKDFDLCLEFVMRNMLSREEADYIRDRYEKKLTFKAIAENHGVSSDLARNRVEHALKRLRHPSRSKFLWRGMLEGLKSEISLARRRAYSDGYYVGYEEGYQKCWGERLSKDLITKKRIEMIRKELPQYVEQLELSGGTKNRLNRLGITKVETLFMLSKLQIRSIKGIGRDTSDEIITIAEKLGFPLTEGIPSRFE